VPRCGKGITALPEFAFDPIDFEVGVFGKGIIGGSFRAFEKIVPAGAEFRPWRFPIDTKVETRKTGVRRELENFFYNGLRLTLHDRLRHQSLYYTRPIRMPRVKQRLPSDKN
jgi:hypothetical protein